MNTIGNILRLTTWGESHGAAIGGVVDGFPPLFCIDVDEINAELRRRKTGIFSISSQRKEEEEVEILSGLKGNVTLGTPISFLIRNKDVKSSDYDELEKVYRPSHADYTYQNKYGIRDHRGGGRSSARETVVRVVAGSMAKQWLRKQGIIIAAYAEQIGDVKGEYRPIDVEEVINNRTQVGALDSDTDKRMLNLLENAKQSKNSIGGIVRCVINGVQLGVGEPLYDKLSSRLAYSMLSIPASKGFDFGSGFEGVEKYGSELNDQFYSIDDQVRTKTNHSGGIQGGISNGEQIYFRVVFKPISSISIVQHTVNIDKENVDIAIEGRHDVSVFPRVLPIVESMAALVLMDFMQQK